jgi:HEAT repeat protein
MAKLVALMVLLALPALAGARSIDASKLDALVGDWDRFAEIEALGPDALPALARLYEASPYPARRRTIADVFYRLGQKSPDAKRVLLADLGSRDRDLRLAVQWALGRVSADDDVVPRLLEIMRTDSNPIFREKAGCALANDQIHLSPEQRLRLYEGLIAALDDPKPQVRSLAIRVLRIHTGETQGFAANAALPQRVEKVQAWQNWLMAAQEAPAPR